MKEKRILFVANVAKEHINKFHIPTIKCFKEHGWRVDVACSGEEKVPECNHHYRMCWKRSPFTVKTIRGILDLKKIVEREKYDIVYCHTPVGGLVARLSCIGARKRGTKVVYCAHGLHFFKGAPVINWLIYYPIEKFLSYFTDVFFTVNEEDYKCVRKRFNKRMIVKYVPEVGVDFSRLEIENSADVRKEYRSNLKIESDETGLIYVAELIENKNQTMLIDMQKQLIELGEKTKLILVGPDHADGLFQKYAKEQGVGETVLFLGWRSDIGELMHAADICVASSIREGFGINLVEAMYCGLPVIATNNRGHVTVIKDNQNGFLVNTNDSKKMVKRVRQLIHDKETYKRMANQDASKYDCNIIATELYDALIKNAMKG